MKILQHKKALLLILDALLIPGLFLCEKLSDLMLSRYTECPWVTLGGKCVTCGGTHFVNAILNGDLIGGFHHNAFLFLLLVLGVALMVLIHLDILFHVPWVKKAWRYIFSIPTLILLLAIMLVFFFARNIPVFMRVIEILRSQIG
jgi:hypothetical protein